MTLANGTRLGAYEILGPLGAGGMGEVYRARDTKLAREVAIKVLPSELSGDLHRLERFEKEARTASALNHPNIVTIYEVGRLDATSFIAMELVAGKTLRELMIPGALPLKRLLAVAAQAADGLAKAHAAGIVHRDLKPENLMVTRDGFVKILDFGLAKLIPGGFESSERTNLPTMTRGPRRAPCSAPSATCRRSRRAATRWTFGPISSRSARSSTRWPRASARSIARRRCRRCRPSSRTSRSRWPRPRRRLRRTSYGSSSVAWPRTPTSATARPRTSLGIWPLCAITPPACPSRAGSLRSRARSGRRAVCSRRSPWPRSPRPDCRSGSGRSSSGAGIARPRRRSGRA